MELACDLEDMFAPEPIKSTECQALLDACTPELYRRNAFRITGLFVDANSRDVKRQLENLRYAEELGEGEQEHGHAFALKPSPGLEAIREAMHKLQDPERRLTDEFFWFWPMAWGKSKQDAALNMLKKGDKEAAFRMWCDGLSHKHPTTSTICKHNLAVMYNLVALDSEQLALERNLSQDSLAKIEQYWRTCFRWWEELTDDEFFWSIVTERIRILDDPSLTTGFARRIRSALPEALHQINASLALKFLERGKLELAQKHLTYMKETHQGSGNVPKTIERITRPQRDRLDNAIANARKSANNNPADADKTALELLEFAREPIRILSILGDSDDDEGQDLCDAIVDVTLECVVSIALKTENWESCLIIIDKAGAYAKTPDSRSKLTDARTKIKAREELAHPAVKELLTLLEDIEGLEQLDQLRLIYKKAPDLLASILSTCPKTSPAYEFCLDSVAAKLREIAVEIHNSANESPTAMQTAKMLALSLLIHDRAYSLVCGQELKQLFRKDRDAFLELRQAIDAGGAMENIRRQLIQEGLLPLWGQREDILAQHKTSGTFSAKKQLVTAFIGLTFIVVSFNLCDSSPQKRHSISSEPARVQEQTAPPPESRDILTPQFTQPELPLPRNGWIRRYHTTRAIAPLNIMTRDQGIHYFVKIEDYYTETPVLTVFVRGGSSVDVEVPLGSYRVKYASGRTWYGTDHRFGPHGSENKADERFDFRIIDNHITGYTIELYKQYDGNLQTTRIPPSEF